MEAAKDPKAEAPKPSTRTPVRALPTAGKLSQRKQLNNIGAEVQRLDGLIHQLVTTQNEIIEKHNAEVARLNREVQRVNRLLIRSQVHERILLAYAHQHASPLGGRVRRWVMGIVLQFMMPLTSLVIDHYTKDRLAEIEAEGHKAAEAAKAVGAPESAPESAPSSVA